MPAVSSSVPKSQTPSQAGLLAGGAPVLVAGDHLTRPEFERRYERMPELKKAELIEGIVHMGSPVRLNHHGAQHFQINTWAGVYAALTPGVQGADNATIRLDQDNEPQPDVLLRILPECGGQSTNDGDYIGGAPEFVAEICGSSASYDLFEKKTAYRRNGVREYLVWLVEDHEVIWWRLHEGDYVPIAPDSDGSLKSSVFPGLWLDPVALLDGDMARVLDLVREGTGSDGHAALVESLKAARRAWSERP
jgi:Uma2 family endonuclease